MKRANIFSRLSRKKLIVLLSLLLIIIVTIPLTILLIRNPPSNNGSGRSVTDENGGAGTAATGSNCTSTGVVKNPGASYTFSWLHVDAATYTIRDENNCIVILRGIVQPAAFGDGGASITRQEVQLLSQSIHVNFWRLNLNAIWWNTNVTVPKVHMSYQQWIKH